MAQQAKILVPTVSPEIFNLRFPDNVLSPALSTVDTFYSVESKPFYFKQKGDSEARIINIDGLGINNPFVVPRQDNNFILTTP